MTLRDNARIFANVIARAIYFIEEYDEQYFNKVESQKGFCINIKRITKELNSIWDYDYDLFIRKLNDYIDDISNIKDEQQKFIDLFGVIIWLDQRISYENTSMSEGFVSLWPICHYDDTKPFIVYSLNDKENVIDTHIWINPKYQIRNSYDEKKNKERRGENKNVFYKMNNYLNNCSYFIYDGKRSVKNVIISNGALANKDKKILSIAFSPLSDKHGLINREDVNYERDNFSYKGMICSLRAEEAENIFARTQCDWEKAGLNKVDILFMPEMMGTRESCGIKKHKIEWMNQLYEEKNQEEHTPMMTILPSYWENNSNTSTIVSYDGTVLGVQKKYEPYVSSKDQAIEALAQCEEKETIIIHVPKVHRIAVIICSEFLVDDSVNWSKMICACSGVSLIIVPSFSPGEKDFIDRSVAYRYYDTTVLWGNCCGAIRDDNNHGIGGCGVTGELEIKVFRDQCKCHYKCEGINSCAFKVDIAMENKIRKGKKGKNSVINHYVCEY